MCVQKNKEKNAVDLVLKDYFNNYQIISLANDFKISVTPIGDDNGILGCRNKIDDALKQINDGDLYIAMEGIKDKNNYGSFLCGWTVIYNKYLDEYYYGCSSKIRIPNDILKEFDENTRLSLVVVKYMNSTDEYISNVGTNGVLTYGAYTRTNEFNDSVLCAISSKYKKLERKNKNEI